MQNQDSLPSLPQTPIAYTKQSHEFDGYTGALNWAFVWTSMFFFSVE